jgi:hypothetical protein
MTLVIVQLVFPIVQIGSQVNFFSCPEAGFGFFVKIPNIAVLNWEQYEPVFVLF